MKLTEKIVRIGGQSKCAALEAFSLKELKKRASRDDVSRNTRQFSYETRMSLKSSFE